VNPLTRTTDGFALNSGGSDPSFAGGQSTLRPPRSSRRRLRLRVTTEAGSTFTVNLNAEGICIEQLRVLRVGTQVAGSIHLDGQDSPFAGWVAWAASGDSRLNQLGRMGVCFARIAPEFAQGLAARDARAALAVT
jgi:hypothetical protein